ncbi:MAG: PrpF domain-containing protein, partial [Microbacteriaceae bacterium]
GDTIVGKQSKVLSMKRGIRATIMRGGTSKGVFMQRSLLPDFGPELDALLLDIMGSPDAMQIDGLGGTHSSTSKVVLVEAVNESTVRYWFAQIGVAEAIVDWDGNCGNLTTAVGPYAIDEGLVTAVEPLTILTLINENTGVSIIAEVQLSDGESAVMGELHIAGVPNPGSPVMTRYLDPSGSVINGEVFPSGNRIDLLESDFGVVPVTIADITHPYVFISAASLGLNLETLTQVEANADPELLQKIESIRGAAAVLIGQATDLDDAKVNVPSVPRIVVVATDAEATLRTFSFAMLVAHHAIPMTAALCLAGTSHYEGTVLSEHLRGLGERVTLRHPKGIAEVAVQMNSDGSVRSLGVLRTARKLMVGEVFPRALYRK